MGKIHSNITIIIIYIKIIILFLNINLLFNIKFLNNIKIIKKNLYKNYKSYKYFYLERKKFNISLLSYSLSFKFNIIKILYNIYAYDENNNLIKPSDLSLFHKLHIFCNIIDINSNIGFKDIANNINNEYYNCIEFLNIKQKVKIGFIIYKINKYSELFTYYLLTNDLIDYNNIIFQKDNDFDLLYQIDKFKLKKKMINETKNQSPSLESSFYLLPKFTIKYYLNLKKGNWYFKNIYNHYFCFCKYKNINNCFYTKIKRKCKYYFFLNIIDNNRNLYKKTDYLFADFSSSNTSPCEAYIVFNEMVKKNLSVHYITKREDIYKKFSNISYGLKMPIIFDGAYINGDFLEKYLDLILKLKAVISGAKIYSVNNLFYNIEYITYICLGHGISYLKDFLYKDYYSYKIYNKILLPPSRIIISNAKKYGWKYNNIIKIGLPRWDIITRNDNKNHSFQINCDKNNRSIFAMFSWRHLKENQSISKYYLKNIFKLINNKKLNKILKENNISFYYSLHHMIEKYKLIFQLNKFISYINQEQIIECISNSSLILSDFSSIIFDAIVRRKPYIIFIPDSIDSNIKNIYDDNYYTLINNLKNGVLNFENRFFNIKDTINKIIYYIYNNFELEPKINTFYKSFQLEGYNHTQKFINYLININ